MGAGRPLGQVGLAIKVVFVGRATPELWSCRVCAVAGRDCWLGSLYVRLLEGSAVAWVLRSGCLDGQRAGYCACQQRWLWISSPAWPGQLNGPHSQRSPLFGTWTVADSLASAEGEPHWSRSLLKQHCRWGWRIGLQFPVCRRCFSLTLAF